MFIPAIALFAAPARQISTYIFNFMANSWSGRTSVVFSFLFLFWQRYCIFSGAHGDAHGDGFTLLGATARGASHGPCVGECFFNV